MGKSCCLHAGLTSLMKRSVKGVGSVDEVFLTRQGQRHAWWRAVDHDDTMLDMLVQRRCTTHMATPFVRTLLKGLPDVIITEKLKSDGATKRAILPGVEHCQRRSLHNRCEHAQRPTRHRAYRMQGLQSAGHAQCLLSAYGPIAHPCRPCRSLLSAPEYRQGMQQRCESWVAMTSTERAA